MEQIRTTLAPQKHWNLTRFITFMSSEAFCGFIIFDNALNDLVPILEEQLEEDLNALL